MRFGGFSERLDIEIWTVLLTKAQINVCFAEWELQTTILRFLIGQGTFLD